MVPRLATFTPTPTSSKSFAAATPSATLTPRPAATSTNVSSSGPNAVPTGGTVAFNVIGEYIRGSKIQYQDITAGPLTLWTSSNPSALLAYLRASGRHLHDGICGMRLYPREQFWSRQSAGWHRRLSGTSTPAAPRLARARQAAGPCFCAQLRSRPRRRRRKVAWSRGLQVRLRHRRGVRAF